MHKVTFILSMVNELHAAIIICGVFLAYKVSEPCGPEGLEGVSMRLSGPLLSLSCLSR